MQLALLQAQKAQQIGEVPVGAIVELNGEIIGAAYNQNRCLNDPSAHAEILALRAAAKTIGNYRLNGARLFVTIEPCVMCAGAILHARINTLIYGAADERWGATGSVVNVLDSPLLNHKCKVVGGVMAPQAANLMQTFFTSKR